jgi:hypothetical protein
LGERLEVVRLQAQARIDAARERGPSWCSVTQARSALKMLSQPESRAYYDKKRKEGKHHVALARRRVNVLFAMLRDGTFYQAPAVTSA